MLEGYLIKIVDDRGHSATFGTGKIPNDVSITITKDATAGIFNADVVIFGVSPATFKTFATSNMAKPIKQVEITTTSNGNENVLFKGVIANTPEFDNDDFCLSFQAVSSVIGYKTIQITRSSQATRKELKLAFAQALGLRLSTNSPDDFNTIGEDYKFFGSSYLTELKRRFVDDNVFINNGILFFQDKKNRQKTTKIEIYDITKYITKIRQSNNINAIICDCIFLPQLNIEDVVKIDYPSHANPFYKNLNGTYSIRKVEHTIEKNYLNNNNKATTQINLLSSSNIVKI